MAEFNCGAGGDNSDNMIYEKDYESFEDKCHPMLSFYMWHDTLGSEDYIEVWIDTGDSVGGANWEFVDGPFSRLCCPGCPLGWMEHIVDLGAYAGDPDIRIGFKGYADANPQAYNIHIDDVSKYDQEFYQEKLVDIDVGETVDVEFDDWCLCHAEDDLWDGMPMDVHVVAPLIWQQMSYQVMTAKIVSSLCLYHSYMISKT
jgi:hypothetical protein